MKITLQPDILRQLLFVEPTGASFDVFYSEGNDTSSYRILTNVNKMQIFDYISTNDNFNAVWTIQEVGF